jgi:uncharacterized protein YdhG (YjbR/CyaY superfamily)
MAGKTGFDSIDEYIATFPKHVQRKLVTLRKVIRKAAPEAVEKISYQMPTFFLNGNLVYFAAHTRHIGFYPTSSGIRRFARELCRYKSSRGAVQFPIEETLPVGLIVRIVEFRVRENLQKKKKSTAAQKNRGVPRRA